MTASLPTNACERRLYKSSPERNNPSAKPITQRLSQSLALISKKRGATVAALHPLVAEREYAGLAAPYGDP